MPLALRLSIALAGLVVVFAGAGAAGATFGPDRDGRTATPDSHGVAHAGGRRGARDVRGLGVADGGLRLVDETTPLRPGRAGDLRFRIAGPGNRTVRGFETTHTKRMHAIVVRRDLTGFRHLHPRQEADGSWRVRWTPSAAGSYRLYADFRRDGRDRTLAADMAVRGAGGLRALPAPSRTVRADGGHRVTMDSAGGDRLRFAVTRGGRAIDPEPYLGAGGHLVALREADGAFLHVHPASGGALAFDTEFPTAGTYRLFLQFKDAGRVHTAAFTKEVR